MKQGKRFRGPFFPFGRHPSSKSDVGFIYLSLFSILELSFCLQSSSPFTAEFAAVPEVAALFSGNSYLQ